MRVLLIALMLCAAGHAWGQTRTALIINLGSEAPPPIVLDALRKDLRLAGYSPHQDARLRKALLEPLDDSGTDFSKETATLKVAREAYESFELAKAVAQLESFDRSWRKKAPSSEGRGLLARRYLLGGLIRFAQGNETKARDNFRLSHRLDPARDALPESEYRPAVVELFASAVKDNERARALPLVGRWQPDSAELLVDGHPRRREDPISAGPHLIRLSASGFESSVYVALISEDSSFEASLNALDHDRAIEQLHTELRLEEGLDGVAKLAELSGAGLLILLDAGQAGASARIYRVGAEAVSAPLGIGSRDWRMALRQDPQQHELDLLASKGQSDSSPAWYRTWWGGSMLAVGTSAVVGSALYFLLSPGSADEGGVTIDQWCIGSCN